MTDFIPYAERDGWQDITPMPQDEGPDPLSAIAYTPEYRDAMDTFRALLQIQEKSSRALQLTEHILRMNAAHYSVWAYRSAILFAINSDLSKELELMDELIKEHLKSYQVWQHRRNIIVKLNKSDKEIPFTNRALAEDPKNYHTWAYRQWVLHHFNVDEMWKAELPFVDRLLEEDIRNNSAWNHRWFCIFEREGRGQDEANKEIAYTKDKIRLSPGNPSAWNYLKGILNLFKIPYFSETEFAEEFASTPALEFLAGALIVQLRTLDIEQKATIQLKAQTVLHSLASQYDPVRKQYWEYLQSKI